MLPDEAIAPPVVDQPPTEVLGEVLTQSPELPRTGAQTQPLGLQGVAMVLLGACMVLLGRLLSELDVLVYLISAEGAVAFCGRSILDGFENVYATGHSGEETSR